MRRWGFLPLMMFVTAVLFADSPWSYSLGASGVDLGWFDEADGLYIQQQMLGLDVRGSSLEKATGFYYGSYLNFAVPMYSLVYDPYADTSDYGSTAYDFYTSFGLPFGYRWEIPVYRTAAYLGVGPAMQALFDFDSHMWASGGMMVEFGLEALEKGGVTFAMGVRMLIGWGSFATDWETIEDRPVVTTTSLFMGIGWRGIRKG